MLLMWHVFSIICRTVSQPVTKEGDLMRRVTLLLFQLFLALFAGYAVLYDVPNEYLIVPLLCLVCMLFLGRHPKSSSSKSQQKLVLDT
jgi:hypothetical protein